MEPEGKSGLELLEPLGHDKASELIQMAEGSHCDVNEALREDKMILGIWGEGQNRKG